MKIILTIVGFIGLAIGTDASCFKFYEVPVREIDELSAYLVGKIPSNDTEANLRQLSQDLDNLSGPKREAAELLLDLSRVPTEGCSEELRALIDRAEAAGLKSDRKRRTDEVIHDHLIKALDSCEKYLFETFEERISARKDELLSLINSRTCGFACTHKNLVGVLKIKSRREPEAANCGQLVLGDHRRPKKVVDLEKFNAVYDKYLVEPCKEFQSKLGDITRPFNSIREIHRGSARYYDIDRKSSRFERLFVFQNFCDYVSGMDQESRTYMSKKFCIFNQDEQQP